MSSLNMREKRVLEDFPGMGGGYVLNFSDRIRGNRGWLIKFGNALIDAWLASQGRQPGSFNAIERLCYTGERGMGALEFAPVIGPRARQTTHIEVSKLVELASEVLTHRNNLQSSFAAEGKGDALRDILGVGTSAGGARAKAVIAWNPETNEVRSGQVQAGKGFGRVFTTETPLKRQKNE